MWGCMRSRPWVMKSVLQHFFALISTYNVSFSMSKAGPFVRMKTFSNGWTCVYSAKFFNSFYELFSICFRILNTSNSWKRATAKTLNSTAVSHGKDEEMNESSTCSASKYYIELVRQFNFKIVGTFYSTFTNKRY